MKYLLSLLGGLCLFTATAGAATITNIVVVNNSTADYAFTSAWAQAEFRSGNIATSAVDVVGNLSSFSNQFGWLLAGQSAENPDGDAMAMATVSYEMFFTVSDPGDNGYILFADSDVHGWLSAEWITSLAPGDGSYVSADGTSLDAEVSRNGNYVAAPNLAITGSTVFVDENSSSSNDLVLGGGGGLGPIQSGTHTYSLRFTGLVSTVIVAGGATGEAALRFGQNPTLSGFNIAASPGTDGETLDQLGHFVNVRMLSFDPADAVPEPAMAIPVMLALGAGWAARRRRRA